MLVVFDRAKSGDTPSTVDEGLLAVQGDEVWLEGLPLVPIFASVTKNVCEGLFITSVFLG